jgi:predicted permease
VPARLRSFLRSLGRRARFEAELDDELRFHLEARAADLVRGGLDPAAARRRARLELGAPEAHKEEVRAARGLRLLDEAAADLRFAVRGWRKQLGLALAVTATLTVGIGVSTAGFTLIHGILFRPQVYGGGAHQAPDDPRTFVQVHVAYARAPARPGPHKAGHVQFDDLRAMESQSQTLVNLIGRRNVSAALGDADRGEVVGVLITCNALTAPGRPPPLLGRLLDRRDCAGATPVVVLGEPVWRDRFGADPAVVGRVLRYGPLLLTVVGIAARRVDSEGRPRIYLPHTLHAGFPEGPARSQLFVLTADLATGATRKAAAAELATIVARQDRLHPGRNSAVVVTDGSIAQVPGQRAEVWLGATLWMGIIAMIVLLVAANVVTLLLGRAHARRHEVAVRLALGAGRARLLKMLLTETLVLALAAAALSLPISRGLPPLIVSWLGKDGRLPPLLWVPDWTLWTFLVAVTVLATVSAGLAPALEALKGDVTASLKGRVPAAPSGRGRDLRGLLIATQVAISVALLVGAALFVRGYVRKLAPDPGFEPRQALAAPLRLRGSPAPRSWSDLHLALRADLVAQPGITAVAFERPGDAIVVTSAAGLGQTAFASEVSPGFFQALGAPVLRGRALVPGDAATGALVPVVVSHTLAAALWPERDPIGQRMQTPGGGRFEVVGVAGDVIRPGRPRPPDLYRPLTPGPDTLLVRFSGDSAAAIASVAAAVRRAAAGLTTEPRTFQQRFIDSADTLGRAVVVAGALGLVALLLAVIGVYGVVAFAARRCLKELGIRRALGAQPGHLLYALVSPIAKRVGIGLGAGLALAAALSPGLRPLVGDLDLLSPVAYLGAALLMAAAAFLAMWRPARHALTVDPAVTLRED